MQTRYRDEIDAKRDAQAWLEEVAFRRGLVGQPTLEIRYSNHTNDGATLALWHRQRPIALAVVLRDDVNWSVMTRWEAGAADAVDGNENAQ